MSEPLAIGLAALLTAAIMATNLWAVVRDRRDVERVTKPAAMIALLAVAALTYLSYTYFGSTAEAVSMAEVMWASSKRRPTRGPSSRRRR